MARILKNGLLLGLVGLILCCCTLGCRTPTPISPAPPERTVPPPKSWGTDTRDNIIEGVDEEVLTSD